MYALMIEDERGARFSARFAVQGGGVTSGVVAGPTATSVLAVTTGPGDSWAEYLHAGMTVGKSHCSSTHDACDGTVQALVGMGACYADAYDGCYARLPVRKVKRLLVLLIVLP